MSFDAAGGSTLRFRRVGIVGVGLIGGSFALALKTVKAVDTVVGFGRSRANLDTARKMGVIDEIATGWDDIEGCDLILLAVPVGQLPEVMPVIAPRIGKDTVITDAGSTKRDVVRYARAALGKALPRFVPAHPITGKEASGIQHADADLYRGRQVIITPLPQNPPELVQKATDVWSAIGAQVNELTSPLYGADAHIDKPFEFERLERIIADLVSPSR